MDRLNFVGSKESKNSLPLVTFFKGLAILMVILVHSSQRIALPDVVQNWTSFGQMGCQIFFVLSSFTIALSIERKKTSTIQFFKNRIFKIWPSWALTILIYICIGSISMLCFGSNLLWSSLNPIDVIVNLLMLNGFVPTAANNLVVRGGWFVGTIVIFYLITPFVFKLYMSKNEFWTKHRVYLFPILTFIASSGLIILLGLIDNRLLCKNNSFIYFSAINQFTPYSLGFCLFDLYKHNRLDDIRIPLVKGLGCLLLCIIAFYWNFKYAFVLVPTLFSIAFVYLYIFCDRHATQKFINLKIFRAIEEYGRESFSIYLTHTFIVFDMALLVIKMLEILYIDIAPIFLWIALLPIMYALTFFVGKLYGLVVKKLVGMFKTNKEVLS